MIIRAVEWVADGLVAFWATFFSLATTRAFAAGVWMMLAAFEIAQGEPSYAVTFGCVAAQFVVYEWAERHRRDLRRALIWTPTVLFASALVGVGFYTAATRSGLPHDEWLVAAFAVTLFTFSVGIVIVSE